MEATSGSTVHVRVRRTLFAVSFLLLLTSIAGYGYWKANPFITLNAAPTPEHTYYQQLVYVVNEMNNQVEAAQAQYAEGAFEPASTDTAKGQAYVASLMAGVTEPPEEIIVAQAITENMYTAYLQYWDALEQGGEIVTTSYDEVNRQFHLFRQNAALITLLSTYQGVNVECH